MTDRKIPREVDIENALNFYNVYATLKERRILDKAFQNENATIILKFAFKYRAHMEAVVANTDLRLYRYNTLLQETPTWKDGIKDY